MIATFVLNKTPLLCPWLLKYSVLIFQPPFRRCILVSHGFYSVIDFTWNTFNTYCVTAQHCSVLQALSLNFLILKLTMEENHIQKITAQIHNVLWKLAAWFETANWEPATTIEMFLGLATWTEIPGCRMRCFCWKRQQQQLSLIQEQAFIVSAKFQ